MAISDDNFFYEVLDPRRCLGAGDAAVELISAMLRLEPERRPSNKDVLGSVVLREQEESHHCWASSACASTGNRLTPCSLATTAVRVTSDPPL